MFFVMRERTKERLHFGFRIIVTIIILGMVITHLFGIYNGYIFTSQGLLREDKPSGNPMRVEHSESVAKEKGEKENIFDSFVVKLKDFYKKD